MPISRYNERITITNNNTNYIFSSIFRRRGLNAADQFTVGYLEHPDAADLSELEVTGVTWTAGQKYFKLAHEYYGSAEYWWVIAWYNQIPLETDIMPGDVINIPEPLEAILELFEVI